MNESHYAKLFKLLDGYAKRHHACFLAELFLSSEETGDYLTCFRPQISREDTANRYACQYITMERFEVREMLTMNLIPISVANILEEKLTPLNLRIKAR